MLNILHNKINQIASIISIQEINNDFIIEYTDPNNISEEQIFQIQSILNSWPLDKSKIDKLQILDNKWHTDMENGFETNYGWKLGLKTSDVTLLTGAFLLAKEASIIGLSQDATIMDTEGVSHTMSINLLTTLMLEYGQYRSALSYDYSSKKQLIEQAVSQTDLDNIII